MAQRRSAEFWNGHIESWRQSGQTQAQYCATHELNHKTFGRWHGKARRAQAAGESKLTLVPVSLPASATHHPIQLHSPNGWRIELAGLPASDLVTLLKQLP
jgi:hypothetical protein